MGRKTGADGRRGGEERRRTSVRLRNAAVKRERETGRGPPPTALIRARGRAPMRAHSSPRPLPLHRRCNARRYRVRRYRVRCYSAWRCNAQRYSARRLGGGWCPDGDPSAVRRLGTQAPPSGGDDCESVAAESAQAYLSLDCVGAASFFVGSAIRMESSNQAMAAGSALTRTDRRRSSAAPSIWQRAADAVGRRRRHPSSRPSAAPNSRLSSRPRCAGGRAGRAGRAAGGAGGRRVGVICAHVLRRHGRGRARASVRAGERALACLPAGVRARVRVRVRMLGCLQARARVELLIGLALQCSAPASFWLLQIIA